jgi:hypothetical protein
VLVVVQSGSAKDKRTLIGGAEPVRGARTPCTGRTTPIGQRLHSAGRDWIATGVTDPIAPVIELGQSPLCSGRRSLQRVPDSDVGHPGRRGPVATHRQNALPGKGLLPLPSGRL